VAQPATAKEGQPKPVAGGNAEQDTEDEALDDPAAEES
jgi:hypothetical protein